MVYVSIGADGYYKYPTALAPTYGRWAPVAHGGALPLGAGAPYRGGIMPHLCVMEGKKFIKFLLKIIYIKSKHLSTSYIRVEINPHI